MESLVCWEKEFLKITSTIGCQAYESSDLELEMAVGRSSDLSNKKLKYDIYS